MFEGVAVYRITDRGMQALGLPIDDSAPAHLRYAKDIPTFTGLRPTDSGALESAVQAPAREQSADDAAADDDLTGAGGTMQDLAFPGPRAERRMSKPAPPVEISIDMTGRGSAVVEMMPPRFGLLDSGELIVLRSNGVLPIIFPVEATERLRAVLAGGRL